MYIDSITLFNYRVYKGENKISFPRSSNKNVFIISGDNGFGKTTFLTSLVWCLYGKQMIDVDEKFKREIADAFGYKNYAKLNLSNELQKKSKELNLPSETKKLIVKNGYQGYGSDILSLEKITSYSVTLNLSNLIIPSVPCDLISIKRSYDTLRDLETLEILIDGKENELSKEVGSDIFINDFILSKDIAKFFFFDSEKIVSLAELKSVEEKRKLSIAYSEVLGVKKYEDLKHNLENLRVRFRRKSSDLGDRDKLTQLVKEGEHTEKLIEHLKSKLTINDEEIQSKRMISEQYQEKLIREGNSITVEELINLKALREELKNKDFGYKNKLKDLLELAPFAIAGKKFIIAYDQMRIEQKASSRNFSTSQMNEKLREIQEIILTQIADTITTEKIKNKFKDITNNSFSGFYSEKQHNSEVQELLLDLAPKEQREFQSIFENVKYSFSQVFKQLVKDDRNNKIFLGKITRKISQAESSDTDLFIKEIKTEKLKIDKQISELEKEIRNISEDIGRYQRDLAIKTKLITEQAKKVSLDETDRKKDLAAQRLGHELTEFLRRLKIEKKSSLELHIRHELNKLMHKTNFINRVQVDIEGEIIDIRLFDADMQEINKDKLSKGEQQLYATSILKALVEESEIKFPIFIDSPLQKFDKKHSRNIIEEFYPNVSEQVVIFPLLEKELTEDEYKLLLPYVRKSFIIQHQSTGSVFLEVEPNDLYKKFKESNVYSY